MKKHFTTNGKCLAIFEGTTIKGFQVGRTEGRPMFLPHYIKEYDEAGHQVHLDQHGAPWVRA